MIQFVLVLKIPYFLYAWIYQRDLVNEYLITNGFFLLSTMAVSSSLNLNSALCFPAKSANLLALPLHISFIDFLILVGISPQQPHHKSKSAI